MVAEAEEMQRSHKIQLNPNNAQATYFAKACGVSRLTYNWALAEWKEQYSQGEKPSAYGLKKRFNSIKRGQYPFVTEVTKWAPERAFMDLEKAFKNFFRRLKQGKAPGYPKFKKKGVRDSFYVSGSVIRTAKKLILIPKLGWVKMTEELRYAGKIQSVTISKRADRWFVSISVEVPDVEECDKNQVHSAVGVDLGVKSRAILSDGTVIENLRVTQKFAELVRRANKRLARKVRGSNNWKKQKVKLSKLHLRIHNTRSDATHKLTAFIANNYSDVCVEDLNAAGMVINKRLAKAVADASFGEIIRQLNYKCIRVHKVSRWFPSTRLCGRCGQIHDMPLGKRTMKCDCGVEIDRDLNAAINILRQGLPDYKPVELEALITCHLK